MKDKSTILQYFGTDLNSYGHYFFALEGDYIRALRTRFEDLPFNPEQLLVSGSPKGAVWYGREGEYSICAISGSCKDTRGGTKSVFWTTDLVQSQNWKELILSVPIARRMIEQMPFEVKW